jgi:hypothetical protein
MFFASKSLSLSVTNATKAAIEDIIFNNSSSDKLCLGFSEVQLFITKRIHSR